MVWEMIRPIFFDDDQAQNIWKMINPVNQQKHGAALVETCYDMDPIS